MATNRPRITISLDPEQYEILKRLAVLQKAPMAGIVSDLVAEVTPVLARVADSLELAMRAQQGVRANLKRVAEEAEADLKPLTEMARSQFDMFADEIARIVGGAAEGASGGVEDESNRLPDHSEERARTGSDEGTSGRARKASSPRPVITGATESQREPKTAPKGSRKSSKPSRKSASLGEK